MSLFSCGSGNSNVNAHTLPIAVDTVSFKVIGEPCGDVIIIKDTINLNNRKCILPEGITLRFKGGVIKNGTLVGNKTRINCEKGIFDHVRILGSWNAPVIKTSCFSDLWYDNSLKDVLALSDSSVNNTVYIEKGYYQVTAYKNSDVCVPVTSNTKLFIDGTIELTPNDYRIYSIIQAVGHNITICGDGTIIGDKQTHTGKKGEWGMGIDLENAHNVVLNGLTIKNCWGDCIYVGTNSTNVVIEKCCLENGRRQGISITSANKVKIKNCVISYIGGTNPEYAIDVEPNEGEKVDNVFIMNVSVNECGGGFLVYGKAQDARIGRVTIRDCFVNNVTKIPISIRKCDSILVDNCILESCKHTAFYEDVSKKKIRNVIIK